MPFVAADPPLGAGFIAFGVSSATGRCGQALAV
jgi:hypothetical protein